MNAYIILNPWAGRGKAGRHRSALEKALRDAGVAFDLVETHMRGEARTLTYHAVAQGYELVVAVGGDGTINEVVNGLLDGQQRLGKTATLAIVPLGTASDFAKMFAGIRLNDVLGASQRLITKHTQTIDIGVIRVEAPSGNSQRYFMNGMGIGLDAQVAVESLKLSRLKGFAVYLVAIIRAVAIYKAHPMTVRFADHKIHDRMLFASVANGRSQGGGFKMTPAGVIDDGVLDLCMVQNLRLDQIIRYLPKLYAGTHTTLDVVTIGRARHIEVICANGIPVAADGEVMASNATRVVVEVVPNAVRMLV